MSAIDIPGAPAMAWVTTICLMPRSFAARITIRASAALTWPVSSSSCGLAAMKSSSASTDGSSLPSFDTTTSGPLSFTWFWASKVGSHTTRP